MNDIYLTARYTSLGCWNDRPDRAISGGLVPNLSIDKCYERAKSQHNGIFAVQAGSQCFTSSNASKTYHKYGRSQQCSSTGTGGPWCQEVYKIGMLFQGLLLTMLLPFWWNRIVLLISLRHHNFVVRYCECPKDMPYLEEHEDPGHGTVCRKIKGDRSRYACPTGCSPLGQPPWCKEMHSHRPCRGVSKGNVTIIMIFNCTQKIT